MNLIAQKENMLGRATTIHMRICLGKRGRKTDRGVLQSKGRNCQNSKLSRPLGWSIPRMGKLGCSGALIVEFNAIGKRQELRLQTGKNC
jgi:hypothetical protein